MFIKHKKNKKLKQMRTLVKIKLVMYWKNH